MFEFQEVSIIDFYATPPVFISDILHLLITTHYFAYLSTSSCALWIRKLFLICHFALFFNCFAWRLTRVGGTGEYAYSKNSIPPVTVKNGVKEKNPLEIVIY